MERVNDFGYGVSVLADGSSIVTGIFQETADLRQTPTFTSAGGYDVFVAKLDASGTYEWAHSRRVEQMLMTGLETFQSLPTARPL